MPLPHRSSQTSTKKKLLFPRDVQASIDQGKLSGLFTKDELVKTACLTIGIESVKLILLSEKNNWRKRAWGSLKPFSVSKHNIDDTCPATGNTHGEKYPLLAYSSLANSL